MSPKKHEPGNKARHAKTAIAALVVVAALSAGGLVMADHSMDREELDDHCPDHQGHPNKVNNPSAGSVHNITVNGTEVWLKFSDDLLSVEFFADENLTEPITVEFCIKAGDRAGGKEIGDEGHVSWENNGGQTPEISYVVVYRIVEDENGDGIGNGDGNGEQPCIGPQEIFGFAAANPPTNEISWSEFEGATGYNLYRSHEGGPFELHATTDADTTSFSDTDVIVDDSYRYRATAQVGAEETEHCDEVEVTAIPVFPSLVAAALAATVGVAAYVVSRRRD